MSFLRKRKGETHYPVKKQQKIAVKQVDRLEEVEDEDDEGDLVESDDDEELDEEGNFNMSEDEEEKEDGNAHKILFFSLANESSLTGETKAKSDDKYRMPSHDEMSQFKEAEDSFQSSLFSMEVSNHSYILTTITSSSLYNQFL